MNICAIVRIFLLVLIFSSCIKNKQPRESESTFSGELYEWYAQESWDGRFPMYFHQGYYILEDGSTKYIPKGYSAGDWGQGLATHIGNQDGSALPVGLSVKFVSFAEKKCYGGEFELPIDTIKKYFEKGDIDEGNGEYYPYRYIITGITPGGTVVVWIDALFGQIEIARFQAKEIDLSVKEIWPSSDISEEEFYNIERSDPDKYEYIKKHGLPLGIWDKYRSRFNWELQWELPKDYEVYQYKLAMYNAEKVNPILFFKENPYDSFKGKSKALPIFTTLIINKKDTPEFNYVVMRYDFEELYAIMSKALNKDTPISVHIKVDDNFSTKWYVEMEGKEYPLKGREPVIIRIGEGTEQDGNWQTYQDYLKNPNKAI
ncbi:DUF2931 family protein [Myroides marinus]|uniref:DUF2931 family protein n=1 Tax=Myroides marinus TaxID=703342 RepID=UPI00257686DC|nr:DUF2931 family protein [Myroides marinus]MDM1377929.1 DUF2931 family protein [Myroides marinus]MDM1385200.1 DUF2931 family protein [Myroides marinus]MDM1392413.1 DUF2931 family protein [Myroides marinus]MDM1502982.1 DUF2931 family protein [Myroides marinus]